MAPTRSLRPSVPGPTSVRGPIGPVTHHKALALGVDRSGAGYPAACVRLGGLASIPWRPIRYRSSRPPIVVTHRTREGVVDTIQHWRIPSSPSRAAGMAFGQRLEAVSRPSRDRATTFLAYLHGATPFARAVPPPSCGATRIWGWCARRPSAACGSCNERPVAIALQCNERSS